MLQATGHSTLTGQTWVLLGLRRDNMDRLQQGQPIRLNLEKLDPSLPNVDIIVAFDDGRLEGLLKERKRQN